VSTIKDRAQSTAEVNQSHGLAGNESSRERKFLGTNNLENERSRNELARVPLELLLQGANWPRNEKARYLLGTRDLSFGVGVAVLSLGPTVKHVVSLNRSDKQHDWPGAQSFSCIRKQTTGPGYD